MSRVYDSLKARAQLGKTNSTALARVNSGSALSLAGEMEELERLVGDRIGKLKQAVTEGEAVVAVETEQAVQFVEGLKASIAGLKERLTETQETVERNDAARRQMEESLTAKISSLQHDLSSKDEALAHRNEEIIDLQSDIERRILQIGTLESSVEKYRLEAAEQARQGAALAQQFQTKNDALEFNLKETEEIVRVKKATIDGLEQQLAAKIEEFHGVLKTKEELLARQDAEINDLKSQLKVLTKGIGQMSSFFRQAEGLVDVDGEVVSAAGLDKPADETLESPIKTQSNVTNDTPLVAEAEATGEIVTADFFEPITNALADITGVMAPMAWLIVKEHVASLDESLERFPKNRVQDLIESLAKETSDETLQRDFCLRLALNPQIRAS